MSESAAAASASSGSDGDRSSMNRCSQRGLATQIRSNELPLVPNLDRVGFVEGMRLAGDPPTDRRSWSPGLSMSTSTCVA
jgi:hypothetical protein